MAGPTPGTPVVTCKGALFSKFLAPIDRESSGTYRFQVSARSELEFNQKVVQKSDGKLKKTLKKKKRKKKKNSFKD